MAIKKDITITVENAVSKMSDSFYVYQGDKNIDIYFTIIDNRFEFSTIVPKQYSITIRKPDGNIIPTSKKTTILDNKVQFTITAELVDELDEIGTYDLLIHLYDDLDSRISIPPVSFEVKKTLVSTNVLANSGLVQNAILDEINNKLVRLNGNGRYVKTVWNKGDVITEENLNKIENQLEDLDKNRVDINSQLAEKAKYLKLSELGLDEDGYKNLDIIMSHLTDNNIYFIVDGIYKLGCSSVKELKYDLNLISYTNGGFIFNNILDETFFDLKANVTINNVKFTSNNIGSNILFTTLEENNSKIEKFNITNCEFYNSIRLAYLTYCSQIKEINIKNNTIKNNKISFFQTSEFKINNVFIGDNYVENWFYRLFSITNFQNIEYITVRNNHATNTDDWVFDKITEIGTYYVFGLFKAKKVIYENNIVENMKSTKYIAMYDVYIYADYTLYQNNVFKNNLCFDTTLVNDLMKSKNEGSEKIYKNNIYVIEDSFINKFNIDSNVKVKLYDIWGGEGAVEHTLPVKFTIEGNTVKVPNLDLEISYRLTKEFVFNNNIIECNNITNALVASRFIGSNIIITNNNITCNTNTNFSLVKGKVDVNFNSIIIDNNYIKGIKFFLEGLSCIDSKITNNFVNVTNESTVNWLTTYTNSTNFIVRNNSFVGNITRLIFNNTKVINCICDNDGIIEGDNITISDIGNKTIKVQISDINNTSKFTITTLDDTVNFIDYNNTQRSINMKTIEGNGVKIKNDGFGDSTVALSNTATLTRLLIKTVATKNVNVKISIS